MPSWFSSWLPGLPSIDFALPSGLQARFISFVLKKSLGHFLKPGQLDSRQIDTQIGSGYVQVNDLELDNQAIDAFLSDLPLVLHDGFISSVKARIPWPNPLTSSLGFSVESLHLTFHLRHKSNTPVHANPILANSVASVAESFIHEELTPQEEATLFESFHPDAASSIHSGAEFNLPGGLDPDPFLSTPEDDMPNSDVDPDGVSIFAALFERLLARFEFHAVNTKITLIQPGNISLTISVPEFRYRTEGGGIIADAPREDNIAGYKSRNITITGLTVTANNLVASATKASSPSTLSPRSPNSPSSSLEGDRPSSLSSHSESPAPISPISSSSEEDTPFDMSQSIAFLPPRPSSPTGSITSSIYQSAISTPPTQLKRRFQNDNDEPVHPPASRRQGMFNDLKFEEQSLDEDAIISFGSHPIMIRLGIDPSGNSTTSQKPPLLSVKTKSTESLHVSVATGVIACALQGWHIRAMSDLASFWTANTSQSDLNPSTEVAGSQPYVTLSFESLGLVLLVLPPALVASIEHRNPFLAEFFEQPLLPSTFPHGYLRLFLETITGYVNSTTCYDETTVSSGLRVHPKQRYTGQAITTESSFHLSIGDISLFSIDDSRTPADDLILDASPILIMDFDLPFQHASDHNHPDPNSKEEHPHLPTFEIVDQTGNRRRDGFNPMLWRSKGSHKHNIAERTQTIGSPNASRTAFVLSATRQQYSFPQGKPVIEVEIYAVPMHIFVDLGQVLRKEGNWSFLSEAIDDALNCTDERPKPNIGRVVVDDAAENDNSETDNPPASPRSRSAREKQKEQQRLENFVLKDLDLDLDYREEFKAERERQRKRGSRKPRTHQTTFKVSVKIDMIRLQIQCPPPPGCLLRSGTLIIDVYEIKIISGFMPPAREQSTRFADVTLSETTALHNDFNETSLLDMEFKSLLVAYCPIRQRTATSILSLGPFHSSDQETPSALQPRLSVTKLTSRSKNSSSLTMLSFNIPFVQVDIFKHVLDGLQFWADDVSQLIENTFNCDEDAGQSQNMDRLVMKNRSSSASRSETIVKIAISDAFARAMVPELQDIRIVHPFLIFAFDISVVVELNPKGKDETVLTLAVMDLTIKNNVAAAAKANQPVLSLTTRRNLSSVPTPMVKLRFTSLVLPDMAAKESRVKVVLAGFTCNVFPDFSWISELTAFIKSPPGTFESVIPSERTRISLKISDGSLCAFAPSHPGVVVIHIGNLDFSTDVVSSFLKSPFRLSIPALAFLAIDDLSDRGDSEASTSHHGIAFWKRAGFALLADIADLDLNFKHIAVEKSPFVTINGIVFRVYLCADSLGPVTAFMRDLGSVFKPEKEALASKSKREPTMFSTRPAAGTGIMASIEELAFKKMPEVGPAPDMINDDLPTNLEYLDESFGAAAGLRELSDDDLEEFDVEETGLNRVTSIANNSVPGIVSRVGGETIKMLRSEGIHILDYFFDTLPLDTAGETAVLGETIFRLHINSGDLTLFLHDGYDWAKTRKTIAEEVKEMRRRLSKIRQLVASGQIQDQNFERTGALLFNSLYIGLEQDVDTLEPGALIAAIDEELRDDIDIASESSWQTLKPAVSSATPTRSTRVHGKRLTRSKGPSMEFRLSGFKSEVDYYDPREPTASRTLITVRDLEILDHIKTSTWRKFLTELRSDSRGNIRETNSNMVRVELLSVRPVPGHPSEEARLRAKILPLRLYVDQDAVDFLKKFFNFNDPEASQTPDTDTDSGDIYFQLAEVFPVDLKLDYKPRRVDYRALREGRTIELMNFFHFDGAEMTLRHITLAGITGWPRFFELLNDLWTPDVKATQLVDVISGVAPIRSLVNVGSGVADLVLLPIEQYKKDGRIVRGVQKGTTAFVKSTAIEAIKLGARLATGTQVILEQAEGVLGGRFEHTVTAETVQGFHPEDEPPDDLSDEESADIISKYAQQPLDIKEGMQSAYKSLRKNFNSAAQTILAVPMEVYERSGNEGPVRSVIRAVPIAVLKPMIGASEAVSKTLLGLHNSLDPNNRHDNEAKYKHR